MKRFSVWAFPPSLTAIWVVLAHARSLSLLQDSDTLAILDGIRARHNPLSWFSGDWPLANHFYRPISTLTFEFDNFYWGTNGGGYGLTNAILAALCILLAFWAIREVTGSVATGSLSATLFGLFHVIPTTIFEGISFVGSLGFLVWLGLFRGGRAKLVPVALAYFALIYWASAWSVSTDFSNRVVNWLPGRTASTMTIFCLIAIAAYARYERLSAPVIPIPMSAEDLPATKSTVHEKASKFPWIWPCLTIVSMILALSSYEQAVMLPGILIAIALLFTIQSRRPRWSLHILFWSILVGYAALRWAILPHAMSGYQAQQSRHGPGVFISISNYGLPVLGNIPSFLTTITMGWESLMTPGLWGLIMVAIANVVIYLVIRKDRERWTLLALMGMALVAYLPMAWQKYFAHYEYWPAAMWCGALVVMTRVVGRQVISAVSLPELRAPERFHPAPGSLPRP